MIAWMLLTAAEPKDGYPSAPVVFVSACFGTGLLTALACMKFWKVTLYILGGQQYNWSSAQNTKDANICNTSIFWLRAGHLCVVLESGPYIVQRLRQAVHERRIQRRRHTRRPVV